jgi:hypothetical protein
MKVKAKESNRFLIKDEWYVVKHISHVENPTNYELENHTDKNWNTSWYHEVNFYTLEEVRDMKLKEILNT